MGVVTAESKGYDRVGYNVPMNVRPFGSVFVRAQTEAYGASNDCIPGAISVVNTAVTTSQPKLFFGDADPVTPDPALGDPATPGQYTTGGGLQPAIGLRGRFGFDFKPLPALAVAALPAPAPAPVPPAVKPAAAKTVTFTGASTMKPSKSGTVKLRLTNPNGTTAGYKLAVKSASKVKVGKSRKTVSIASSKTLSLKPGASTVSFKLTKAAKSLLESRKSVKVKVTLTPSSGGVPVTKTLTLQRA